MRNAPREAAAARRFRLPAPWMRRLATLTVLLVAIAFLTPPSGQAFQGPPSMLFPTPLLAAHRTVVQQQTRDPAEILDEDYHDHPLRRVHRVTAYCDLGLTAAGVPSGVGQCAAPGDIPFGAIIHIPELDRSFVVTDRTARRFRQNTVDIFIPGRDDCLEFGLNYLECEIYLPRAEHDYASPDLAEVVDSFAS